MTDAFTEVPAEQAASIKAGKPAAWKTALTEGKVISMAQRPNWTKEDTAHTGLKMRTRSYTDEAGERRFYVWGEKATGEEMVANAVGTTVAALTVRDIAEDDDDMPVPL